MTFSWWLVHAVAATSERGVGRGEDARNGEPEWGGTTRNGCSGKVKWGSTMQDGGAHGEMAAAAMQSGVGEQLHNVEKHAMGEQVRRYV
jgi:hypothetical protein